MDLNRVTLIGRLTQDPEVRTTPSGQSVTNLKVVTNRMWTGQDGTKQERAEFHSCVLWGKLADVAGQYLTKGQKVYVEGRLETRDWTGQDGVKRYRTEIICENMIMLGGPRGSGPAASSSNEPAYEPPRSSSTPVEPEEEEIKVEDIPF